MALKSIVLPSFYQDSVALMRIAQALKGEAGVREAAALMGTPANHGILARAGLASPAAQRAGPNDLILAVQAGSEAAAEQALAAAGEMLSRRRAASAQGPAPAPRTLGGALGLLPGANLAAISVPGPFAKREAMRALRNGLHVFLFSDNVPVEAEVELKREALARGLLCMGPDCGTAYLNGTPLGFANVVPRGRVGIVAASGTGLQAVASRLAALGEGVSQGIGVGGRDLGAEVGGAMTFFALGALRADPGTEAVVLVSKPPGAGVLPRLERALAGLGKPAVVCCLGAEPPARGAALWVETLEDAAGAAAALLAQRAWSPRPFSDPEDVRARLERLGRGGGPGAVGLYTGGTLAHEAHLLLEPLLGHVPFNPAGNGGSPHRVLDLGDDAYTVGRPHPMLDPGARAEWVRRAGRSESAGVLLLDLVLGRAAHPDPARPQAEAVREARAAAAKEGRRLHAVASVVGTAGDPQGLAGQAAQLEAAGVEVLPSNAQACRFAALLLRPGLAERLLK
ncbi:MAG: acyl-CoA synthetase FdrA [Nitrospinota bacterium]